jgi:hypothetical protein
MKINKKNLGAFISIGLIAGSTFAVFKNSDDQKFIDDQLYKYTETTLFQPVEDYRFNIINNFIKKHSSLQEDLGLEPISENNDPKYKNFLKNKENFNTILSTMQGWVYVHERQLDTFNLKDNTDEVLNKALQIAKLELLQAKKEEEQQLNDDNSDTDDNEPNSNSLINSNNAFKSKLRRI